MSDPRVLVVDDQQVKVAAVLDCMRRAGLPRSAIDVAMTGQEARRQLAEGRYDLLVLDLALPLRPEDVPDPRGGLVLPRELIDRDIFFRPGAVVGLTQYDDLLPELSDEFRALHWTLDRYSETETGWMERLVAKTRYIKSQHVQKPSARFATDLCIITGLVQPELAAIRKLDWGWTGP